MNLWSWSTASGAYRRDAGRIAVALAAACVMALAAGGPTLAGSPIWGHEYPLHQPSARAAVAMAYDPTTKQTIMFDGWDGTSASIWDGRYGLNQTWDWNGTDWVRLHPKHYPTRRTFSSLVYDPADDQLLLFGGLVNKPNRPLVPSNETWVWTGSDWKQLHPATSPPGKDDASMAYDPASRTVILFGGDSDETTSGFSNDTWSWDGTTWKQLHPRSRPSAREGAALAWSGGDAALIMFGGETSSGLLHETLRWTGTTWQRMTPVHVPRRRTDAEMAWDPADRQLVMVGGDGQAPSNSIASYGYQGSWLWLNDDWVRTSTTVPKGGYAAGLAYVPADHGLILFGGAHQRDDGDAFLGLSQLMGKTWVYTPHPPA